MTRATFLAAAGVAAATLVAPASPVLAQSRYAPRPPVVLSPNLTEPWMMQLQPRYRDVTGEMPPAVVRMPRPVAVAAPVPVGVAPMSPAYAAAPVIVNPQSDGTRRGDDGRRSVRAEFLPTVVDYSGPHKPGTVVIDTGSRHLFLVEDGGKARRYGIGVGRPGFEWAGEHRITRKAEWPDWRPPPEMLKRQPHLPRFMAGGPANPLGARAMYLGSTMYRIHGSNEPWTIGHAVSSGCIRMRNEDVTDLYGRVKVGTRVIVM